ncbi:MAG: branched-chain amino acid ABC transporter permease [Pseudomonadota bacterium]|nr:branched-chain amino acid ABC transporter permease [Pseudomonadota bacterium]
MDMPNARFLNRHRFSLWELVPLIVAIGCYYLFPGYLTLGAAVLVMAIFAVSLDLVIGYAGIVTLGHSVFFGVGAYGAAKLSIAGIDTPIAAALIAGAMAAVLAVLTGPFVLRLKHLPLIMVTVAIAAIAHEAANKMSWLTGGHDGLPNLAFEPVLGLFNWSIWGTTSYLYVLAWLVLLVIISRIVVSSSFGMALQGIRQNELRMRVMGAPVLKQQVIIYTYSAFLAGIAGALYAQTNNFVSLETLTVDLGVFALAMIVLGGLGRIYGAIIGAAVYMIVQYLAQQWDPYFWMLAIGVLLVLVVRFGKGGLLGIGEKAWLRLRPARPDYTPAKREKLEPGE